MLPILYPFNTPKSGFVTNGLGFISTCTVCDVTEIQKGEYRAALELLPCDRLADSIAPGMFIKTLANPKDDAQIFEIKEMSYTDEKITLTAQHNRYIAFNNVITEKSTWNTSQTPTTAWQNISGTLAVPCLWDFSSNITTSRPFTVEHPMRLGDFFLGAEGSLLDVFGGDFHYDNFKIEHLRRRGRDTGIALRYGAPISSFTQDSDSSTCYTHFYPYAYLKAQDYQTKETVKDFFLGGDLIDLNNSSQYYQRVLAYDFSDQMRDHIIYVYGSGAVPYNYSEIKNIYFAQVVSAYLTANRAQLTDVSANIVVDTETALRDLSDVGIGDTVLLYLEPLGYSARVPVIGTVYDALNERYKSIELGKAKKTLADLFTNKNMGGA